MITINITHSCDLDSLGERTIYGNTCIIGSQAEDIIINDPKLRKNHFMLEIIENKLLAHPLKDVKSFLLNDKIATNLKTIKVGDKITLNQTSFSIVSFELEAMMDKNQFFTNQLEKLRKENSPYLEFIRYMNAKHKQT